MAVINPTINQITNHHTHIRNQIIQPILIRFLKSIFKRLSNNGCSGFVFDEASKPCKDVLDKCEYAEKFSCSITSNTSNRNQHLSRTNLLKPKSVEPFCILPRNTLVKGIVFITVPRKNVRKTKGF